MPSSYDIGTATAPAVVCGGGNIILTADGLQQIFARFQEADDVFQLAFTKGGYLIARGDGSEPPSPTLPDTLTELLNERSSKLLFVAAHTASLPDDPYFLKGYNLHKAWRLYPDENSAFTLAVVPSEDDNLYTYDPFIALMPKEISH